MLKELLEAGPNPWRVVGITTNALLLFKKNNYKKGKKIEIQRAHLNDRDIWYSQLFEQDWDDAFQWYEFICKNDETVLALSSENKNIHYIKFDDRASNLFKSTRISWVHKQAEINFLKDLNAPNNVQAPG